jgi:hypothetical protein
VPVHERQTDVQTISTSTLGGRQRRREPWNSASQLCIQFERAHSWSSKDKWHDSFPTQNRMRMHPKNYWPSLTVWIMVWISPKVAVDHRYPAVASLALPHRSSVRSDGILAPLPWFRSRCWWRLPRKKTCQRVLIKPQHGNKGAENLSKGTYKAPACK